MNKNFVLPVIQKLRQEEEILLYGQIIALQKEEEKAIIDFLQNEYEKESLDYPYTPPTFDEKAALWGAKVIYFAAQLILYREQKTEDLPKVFDYKEKVDANAFLSADLCLRFLPDLLEELLHLDADDPLVQLLENLLQQWHYSGLAYLKSIENIDFSMVLMNPCLIQLYCNRIITYKNLAFAKQPKLKKIIASNLGLHATEFWNDFKIMNNNE